MRSELSIYLRLCGPVPFGSCGHEFASFQNTMPVRTAVENGTVDRPAKSDL